MRIEEWRWIPFAHGLYQASGTGKIKSYHKTSPRILRPGMNGPGYLFVNLRMPGVKRKMWGVHELVALAFIGPRPPGFETNHKNGVKIDNFTENLEYVSRSENQKHAHRLGLKVAARGERAGKAKLTAEQVLDIRRALSEGVRSVELARRYGVHKATIQHIKQRINWRHI